MKNTASHRVQINPHLLRTDKSYSIKTKNANGLYHLFSEELKSIYWSEKILLKIISRLAKRSGAQELVSVLQKQLEITQVHTNRIEHIFSLIDTRATAKKCEALDGIIKWNEEIMNRAEEGVVKDTAIISLAQKIQHYQIASYGILCPLARALGEEEAAILLEDTLTEEKQMEQQFFTIAESSININNWDDEE